MFTYSKPDNLVELFEDAVTRFSDNNLFGIKNGNSSVLNWMTYKEVGRRVDNVRSGLAQLGVGKGDTVGFIGNNRPEWVLSSFATYGLGARFVPMYEAELLDVWKYIICDSEVKVLVVSKSSIYEQVKSFVDELSMLEKIIVVESEGLGSLTELERTGEDNPVPSVQPSPSDMAGLIYTSGTTGAPKGVLLSHGNLSSNAQAGYHLYPELDENSRSISILPWAHSYGQTAELHNYFQFGGSIGFMESVTTLAQDLQLIKPTFMIAVPRVFNKIYDQILAKMDDTGGMVKKLFQMAVETAQKKRNLAEINKSSLLVNLKFALLDKLVFSKIREQFGGCLRGALTASATMNIEIANFFYNVGIPVFDCYGLSETSPAVAMNNRENCRLGSVGKCVEHVHVKIDQSVVEAGAKDGEVIVYGPNIMQGYHNKPDETKAVMTVDGGFRTGDRGRLDSDGFLYITGRIKEQYKLENGKYVFPASIEEDIKLLPHVASAMVYGDGRRFNVCLVVPDYPVLEKFAREHNLPLDPKELALSKEVNNLIADEITLLLEGKYGGYEIPKRFKLLVDDFALENGMLTQTMKLKRQVVIDTYKIDIEELYRS
ncbi:MAG: long-chain fatty acid--CoA ligase [Deltaproteobacteria bacterium]|jgi:long-chain acyl-CoA synthetase|nr:long-chain fatty acid--CoA ligase [Deltaproteobacteria bacterium]MBT4091318.1 long-chain fatty acid--CoA ligase [Deltaproteobacteria bacterium]MBT4268405.1 long-chain fatty acid--CoA ligase [Deltaproteobacteria bacterium]MBT4637680.1 long-chain fatty acid--CoA ligase [Deltaproteobacteria bacterium]MBT6503934.1 long-chain fatty acid--CoA ligase [Deltaproteobacteria bacterium]